MEKSKIKRILCVYATRQIDSNLFMSSSVFNGLKRAGYKSDIVLLGHSDIISIIKEKYGHYFENIYEVNISRSWISKKVKSSKAKLLYSFYLHFFKDAFLRPYSDKQITLGLKGKYNSILSFVPPPINGLFASDLRRTNKLEDIPLIQFWTDPLSLGRCDDINQIPKTRFMHKYLERKILSKADKVVFSYKLLCEKEQELYPDMSDKMSYTHVSYIEHPFDKGKPKNEKITIGLFGAYQRRVRNIEPLLSVFERFPNVQFIIRGDADFEVDAKQYPNLDIEPGRKPANEIEKLESKCDILLSLAGLSGVTQPAGKTFYYANYDKPIIHIGDGIHKDYFEKYLKSIGNRWIICDNTSKSIAKAIQEAIDVLPSFKLEIPECLSPEAIAKSIIEF